MAGMPTTAGLADSDRAMGNIMEARMKYDIDYCASSFDELYDILKKWASTVTCP